MQADVGDRLVVKAHNSGEPNRDGEILEVHGEDGAAPYLVRWSDDGHVGLVFPGTDAFVERFTEGATVADAHGRPSEDRTRS